jgi:hypothetical protein
MTDHAYRTLLASLDTLDASCLPRHYHVSADTWRENAEAAQLRGQEVAQALIAACRDGYLTALQETRGDQTVVMCVQTDHEPGKGRLLRLYRRTDKPIPAHVCEVAG